MKNQSANRRSAASAFAKHAVAGQGGAVTMLGILHKPISASVFKIKKNCFFGYFDPDFF